MKQVPDTQKVRIDPARNTLIRKGVPSITNPLDESALELALEIMFNNTPIASGIRFGKIESIDTNILTGRADGMVPLDVSVKRLLQAGKISRETADRFVSDKRFLSR